MTRGLQITLVICSAFVVSILLVCIVVSTINETNQKAEIAKACVNSGGEWVRDFGSYYKCIRP